MSVPWADDAMIVEVAKLAGVDTFINRHPSGFNMGIGERGEGLSGGQRQSIAIARAILSNASICLFDEPTSAMDNADEYELMSRLKPYLENKTLLLVTHRLPLFNLVERLILLDNGRLIIDGPKEEVLERLRQASVQQGPAKPTEEKPPT